MLRLETFSENDLSLLISAISDARFLLQWAGPKYKYPLDDTQLKDTLAKTNGEQPFFKVFKTVKTGGSETIGHIQLMDIDYNNSNCMLGRVLIFPQYRGKGFGKAMIKCAVEYAFKELGLDEITLGVFDFNKSAIAAYQGIGFVEYQFNKGARQFQNEKWNLIKMKLHKNEWLNKGKC